MISPPDWRMCACVQPCARAQMHVCRRAASVCHATKNVASIATPCLCHCAKLATVVVRSGRVEGIAGYIVGAARLGADCIDAHDSCCVA